MKPDEYMVMIEEEVVGKDLTLEAAMILAEGIFVKYHAEPGLRVTIERAAAETAWATTAVADEYETGVNGY